MQIGKLDQRITIQARTNEPDALGDHQPVWSLGVERWAKVETMPAGGEAPEALGSESRQAYRVTLRYDAGITTRHRILHGARVLQINQVLAATPRGDGLMECLCVETLP